MPNIKQIIIAAFILKAFYFGYTQGANNERAAIEKQTQKERAELFEEFEKKLDAVSAHSDHWRKEAERLQLIFEEKPKQVIEDVEKIKNSANCVNLGPIFRQLHNREIEKLKKAIGRTK